MNSGTSYFLFVITLLFLAYMMTSCGRQPVFVMPNGVECRGRIPYRADYIFGGCTDGKKYYNVTNWSEK